MIPNWHYLVGLIPILVLMVLNERRSRILLGAISIVLLFWFWGGVSKGQSVERDSVRWTLEDMGKTIESGERNAVCDALTKYTREATGRPFNGFAFRGVIATELSKNEPKSAPPAGADPPGRGSVQP